MSTISPSILKYHTEPGLSRSYLWRNVKQTPINHSCTAFSSTFSNLEKPLRLHNSIYRSTVHLQLKLVSFDLLFHEQCQIRRGARVLGYWPASTLVYMLYVPLQSASVPGSCSSTDSEKAIASADSLDLREDVSFRKLAFTTKTSRLAPCGSNTVK